MKMGKCVRPKGTKSTKQTRNLAPPTSARVPVSVCVWVCVSANNNSAHTPTSVASLPPTKERENKQVRERSQHKLSLRWLREPMAMPKGEGERERKGGKNERKLLESKFTRWYMKAYQAANRVSARDIAVNSPRERPATRKVSVRVVHGWKLGIERAYWQWELGEVWCDKWIKNNFNLSRNSYICM